MDNVMDRFKTKGSLKVIQGSILSPHNAGMRFVLSVANTAGKTENPLLPLFDKKWRRVREEMKGWYTTRTGEYKVGALHTTAVQSDTWVIHMLCQDDEIKTDVIGLRQCLKKVCSQAKYEKASVHVSKILLDAMPELEGLLKEEVVDQGVSVCVYIE